MTTERDRAISSGGRYPPAMNEEYPDNSQRYAVCSTLWRDKTMNERVDRTASKFYITGASKSIDRDNRTMTIVATERVVDRDGDIIEPMGADITNYMLNPVILAFHDKNRQPIGKALEVTIDENRVTIKIQFKDRGLALDIFEDYAEGYMNMWSMGFIPKENGVEEMWGEPDADGERRFSGFHVREWELLEVSAVPVPANPKAMTLSKSLKSYAQKQSDDQQEEEEPKRKKETLVSVTIDSLKEALKEKGALCELDLSGTALKKSILERAEAGKIPCEVKEVESIREAGMSLCCTPLDVKDNTVTQARIELITFMIPKGILDPQKTETQEPSTNDKTSRPDEVHQNVALAEAEIEMQILELDLED